MSIGCYGHGLWFFSGVSGWHWDGFEWFAVVGEVWEIYWVFVDALGSLGGIWVLFWGKIGVIQGVFWGAL